MSLPDLPDIFGNYALGDFNEVVSPPAINWLPQTPGWYLVAAVLLAWLARRTWYWFRHWYRNRYRREALVRLNQLQGSDDLVSETNRLLKLTALAAFPRQQVAQLSGVQWTQFLNQRCVQPPFDPALCELLELGVYQQRVVDKATADSLVKASQDWVNQHRNRYDD